MTDDFIVREDITFYHTYDSLCHAMLNLDLPDIFYNRNGFFPLIKRHIRTGRLKYEQPICDDEIIGRMTP